MERRKFISTAGLAGIFATGIAPAVQAGQAIRWRLASSFPKILDIPTDGAQLFARKVKEMSGGKIEISVYAANEVMPSREVLDGVQHGVVECAHTLPHYFIGKDETFALDCTIPFGLNARQMSAWMNHGNGLALLREFYDDFDIVNFPLGNTGAQMGAWYRKPVRSPADFKGLKMRIGGLAGKVLERLGGVPHRLSGGEIYKALERGTIDAAAWIGPYDDQKIGLHRIAKYYGCPAWWGSSAQMSLYINQRAYESLTNENKTLIEAAAALAHIDIQAQYDARNPAALRELMATGAQLMTFPKPVLDAADKAATDLYAEIANKNPAWKKIYASYAPFLKEQAWGAGYTNLSFETYMHQQVLAQEKQKKSAPAGRR